MEAGKRGLRAAAVPGAGPGEIEPAQDGTRLAHGVHAVFPGSGRVNTLPAPLHGPWTTQAGPS